MSAQKDTETTKDPLNAGADPANAGKLEANLSDRPVIAAESDQEAP